MRVDRISVSDDAHAWLVANGTAWRTTDSGATFVDRTPPGLHAPADETEVRLDDLLALTNTHVMIAHGRTEDDETKTTTLYVSRDNGETYVAKKVPRLPHGRSVHLQRGPGATVIARRSDGNGMNSHVDSVMIGSDQGDGFRVVGDKTGYGEIAIQTPTTWWAMGSCCAAPSNLYKSTNAGQTWKVALLSAEDDNGHKPTTTQPQSEIIFVDGAHGYFVREATAARESAVLAVTNDGGRTFADVPVPSPDAHVLYAGTNACVMDGETKTIVTRDLGKTWSELPRPPKGATYMQIAPFGKTSWIATFSAGNGPYGPLERVYVSRDGQTWSEPTFEKR